MSTLERDVLHRDEAAARARAVHDVAYALELDLTSGARSYRGHARIAFGLRHPDEGVFLDVRGRVTSLSVNGHRLRPDHRAHRLWLPANVLEPQNDVVVEYENAFDESGDGCHRFVDPEDGSIYVHSNLEPFSAHRLFPCFDQPDLKASYRLSVTAPSDWRVISAMPSDRVVAVDAAHKRHDFPVTPRFSTYLFAVVAGPYERIGTSHDGIDLGLYARRSMGRELERASDELLEVTAQGLDYFRDLFGQAYPFPKYDQLFVPEFNAGAMENVGAVTLNDNFLFRDPPTYGQRLYRGEVVLHELAHMWFGDLVTMRWWDDLWLNETFATYLSFRCLADATRFRDAWQVFSGQMRPAAYRQDQLVTTHSIATQVEDTDQAVGNFDAITYEKGAAVIKQLVASLGDDVFRAGLRSYFDRHAWSNATLADLLEALGEAAGRSLAGWSRLWLETPSLNTVSVSWTSSNGQIDAMELRQTAPEQHPTLRPHTTSVALVHEPAPDTDLMVSSVDVVIETAVTPLPEVVGRPAPGLVYPNHGDHDYALVSLDPVSLRFALERLPDLPDPLLRQQVWSSLWQMVRETELPVSEYLATVRRFGPGETDRALVQSLVGHALTALRHYLPGGQVEAVSAELVDTAVATMRSVDEPDVRLTWARAAAALALRPDDVELLLGLIDREWSIDGFEPDQQLRWELAIKAAAHDLPGASERLSREEQRDRSDRGRRSLIRAQAARPDASSKSAVWRRINREGYGSDYLTRAAMADFQWIHQRNLLEPYREPFYEAVPTVYEQRDHAFAESYVRWLVPDRWAEPGVLARIRSLRDGLGEHDGLLRRQLDEISDDLARAIRIRAAGVAAMT